jgi:cytidylate kinase
MKPGIKIAISGKSGCGNTTASKLLAQTLDLRFINYTFRNLAQEKGLELKEVLALAEADPSWDRDLDNKQAELAAAGNCVLGSRLAIWILKDADLRVYLKASPETRAARIWGREQGAHPEIDNATMLADTIERDKRDRERYLKLYGIDNDQYEFADLIIDVTNRDPRMILDDIMMALKLKKLL